MPAMSKTKKQAGLLRIADVARLCGVSPSTIRFWEQHGLIQPEYTESGHRIYHEEHLEAVRDIQRLRVVQGLSLTAIRSLRARQTSLKPDAGLTAPSTAPVNTGAGIGPRLRALRKKKGLSLREVAAETGLAASLISTLERTSIGASAASVHKLADFFGTTATELSAPQNINKQSADNGVVRADEARIIPLLGPDIRIEQRGHQGTMMDCQKWTLQPGAQSEEAYSHEGEEFIYVLRGLLEIKLDGHQRHLLYPGDSIYFDSHRIHFWRNPGDEETVLIWVNTPPTF